MQVALERADEALKPLDLLAATLQRELEDCKKQRQGADGDQCAKDDVSAVAADRWATDWRGRREAEPE